MKEKDKGTKKPFSAVVKEQGGPEDLTPQLRERLLRLIPRLLEIGMGCVHSAEEPDDGGEETAVDCGRRAPFCRSVCCSFTFALTGEEVEAGLVRWDPARPFFIARDGDGYCSHHDRSTGTCLIWARRPLRCRRYDCRRENSIWEDSEGLRLRRDIFDHLP